MKELTSKDFVGVQMNQKSDFNLRFLHDEKVDLNQEILPRKKTMLIETEMLKGNNKPVVGKKIFLFFGILLVLSLFVSFFVLCLVPDHHAPDLALEHNIQEFLAFENTFIRESILEDNITSSENSLFKTLSFSEYTVKKGDSLSVIAKNNKLNIGTLISVNKIDSVAKVTIGRKLKIPNIDGLRYVVRRGDSLGKIASRYAIPLNDVLDWNEVSSEVIVVGQVLFLPGAKMSTWDINRVLGRLFVYPTKGRLTDKFGWRTHPITGAPHYHTGIDIANNFGTIIKAANSGTVKDVGFSRSYGNYVIIGHQDGYQTLYGHMQKYVVKRGQWVEQGQKIGEMGSTGVSTGSHLHFGIAKKGNYVDPLKYLN
ncbi:MAG: M23 family metallopeptidase [Spirochaetales bacterium]|nr:M23 family metallopeptidase [Spirochaetales bacterium]